MTDKYLMSLNVRTGQRDIVPPSRLQVIANRCIGVILLVFLITLLFKCS